jgi:hypothetical protein
MHFFHCASHVPEVDVGLHERFQALLDSDASEEQLQQCLAQNQQLLARSFISNAGFVEPKFRFGAEYVSDFVVGDFVQSWHFIFVELEPKDANAFNKDGTPGKRLSQAIRQLSEWKWWVNFNPSYFLSRIKPSIDAMIRSLPLEEYSGTAFLRDLGELNIFNTRQVVIIGRRGDSFQEEMRRRAALSELTGNNVEILTYDWLLDLI